MSTPDDVVLVRGGITLRHMAPADVAAVVRALDAAEAQVGAPLVDEAERERLDASTRAFPAGWHPIVAARGEVPVGYAYVLVEAATAPAPVRGTGDAAPVVADPTRAVFGGLLASQRIAARDASVGELQVWVRHAGEREIDVAAVEGFEVARRLAVLGRSLDEVPERVQPRGHRIRSYQPGEDDQGVVDVLAAAYAGTAEAGWDLDRFRERSAWSWFRPEDLLLAVDDAGHIAGLHWLKRRDAATGEVYNLAVHPNAQGHRLGPALLSAGLHHLRAVGCSDVILWVDRANERAVALYEAQGFEARWDDIALTTSVSSDRRA